MDRDDNIKELIAKNPVNKGLDFDLVDEIMRGVVKRHFPELVTIDSIEHVRHKRRVGKRNSTFIYSYYIRGKNTHGTSVEKHLIYSSHSDGSRWHAYTMLKTLIKLGFNEGDNFKIIVPIEFIHEIQTLVYEAVAGKTLYQYMQENKDPMVLKNILQITARWIHKFHSFPIPEKELAAIRLFDSSNMNWSTRELLDAVTVVDKEQSEKLKAFISAFSDLEKKFAREYTLSLVYGDLHPENIITQTRTPDGLTMIDFTDVTRGDQMRDLGSFIQQMHFMGVQFYPAGKVNELRRAFIEEYFNAPFDQVAPEYLQRINLYQAWNSLRGFVYFFFQESERWRSYGLLEDAWRYLTLSSESTQQISIDQTYGTPPAF